MTLKVLPSTDATITYHHFKKWRTTNTKNARNLSPQCTEPRSNVNFHVDWYRISTLVDVSCHDSSHFHKTQRWDAMDRRTDRWMALQQFYSTVRTKKKCSTVRETAGLDNSWTGLPLDGMTPELNPHHGSEGYRLEALSSPVRLTGGITNLNGLCWDRIPNGSSEWIIRMDHPSRVSLSQPSRSGKPARLIWPESSSTTATTIHSV